MSDVLAGIGLVAAALASGAAILLPPGRPRALLMVAARPGTAVPLRTLTSISLGLIFAAACFEPWLPLLLLSLPLIRR